MLVLIGACSSSDTTTESGKEVADKLGARNHSTIITSLPDSPASICPVTGQRGSVLVARIDPKEEESGISFKLLGDGAGPGVVLCRDVLYADVDSLLTLMGESGTASQSNGLAVIDSIPTQIPAYGYKGVPYVAVRPFARYRRALFVPSPDHPTDATVWPRATLLHLKESGNTRGAAYQAAVREGLLSK